MIPDIKREALLRLRTVHGHAQAVIGMVEREEYCPDVMKQVAALQASLKRVNRLLLENHLETCVSEAIKQGSGTEKVRELIEALRYHGSLTDFRAAMPQLFFLEQAAGQIPGGGEEGPVA